MSYASFPAEIVVRACEEFFACKLQEARARSQQWEEHDKRFRSEHPIRTKISDWLGLSASGFSEEFALSDEYYDNKQIRKLLSLAQEAQRRGTHVNVSSDDARILWKLSVEQVIELADAA